jgi:hypothetical protein
MDDYQLANRKYGNNPPTKNLTKDYKEIDKLGEIPYDSTAEIDLKKAK